MIETILADDHEVQVTESHGQHDCDAPDAEEQAGQVAPLRQMKPGKAQQHWADHLSKSYWLSPHNGCKRCCDRIDL